MSIELKGEVTGDVLSLSLHPMGVQLESGLRRLRGRREGIRTNKPAPEVAQRVQDRQNLGPNFGQTT